MATSDEQSPEREGRRAGRRDETPAERVDRNLLELLNELRVALPGVQVLFAFLLIVPFSERFASITVFQERLYFVVLLLTTTATALLIAPTALHRLLFRQGMKELIVVDSNRLVIAGLAVLALAMTGAVLLVTDVMFGAVTSALAAGAIAALFLGLWVVLPMRHRDSADD